MTLAEDRCRLVLVVPEGEGEGANDAALAEALSHALRGGDVASVILPQYDLSDQAFQTRAEQLVPIIQEAGAAALIAGDSRVAGRVKADGLHMTGSMEELAETIEKFTPKMIVGAGQATDRHSALEVGEARPDYIFFGKLNGDIKPEAHPKNLALGEWWASLVEIPCVVMGGTDLSSALAVAESGAEFVALRRAVFDSPAGPAAAVAEINAMLDEKAPRFGA
ncbi:thiamine phosphate synthase [Rhizobium sp. SSA_523]|uniref:thiamine phosphate synthase n=1 Tax=Rhizobium sp. SSA_523 TaxID=2952477 RepID=UPI0020913C0A|nr:thiamine phosphate synthase [Rhizobium sp. SSA_523]MCO5731959.1 thiamine phosphate synthase [Rhizobium sp. SSA_523]WKC22696.1 thiamine phosphate synthase [Rhizobium sp. SSA_523]